MRVLPFLSAILPLLIGGSAASAAGSGEAIELVFENGAFRPESVTAPAGERLRFHVRNAAAEPFNFEIEALNLSRQIGPNAAKDMLTLEAPAPGVYRFIAEFRGADEGKSPGGLLEVK